MGKTTKSIAFTARCGPSLWHKRGKIFRGYLTGGGARHPKMPGAFHLLEVRWVPQGESRSITSREILRPLAWSGYAATSLGYWTLHCGRLPVAGPQAYQWVRFKEPWL